MLNTDYTDKRPDEPDLRCGGQESGSHLDQRVNPRTTLVYIADRPSRPTREGAHLSDRNCKELSRDDKLELRLSW